jgi:hypothetical protein
MIYKQISSKRIISKVLTDSNIQEETVRISDIVEWIGEAVEKIGGFGQYNIKVAGKEGEPLLTVSNYQAELPDDVYRILGIAYSTSPTGNFLPLRYNYNSFATRQPVTDSSSSGFVASESTLIQLAMDLYNLSYEDALELINTDSITKEKLTSLLNIDSFRITDNTTDFSFDYTYTLNSNYIKLNVRNGYLMIAYQAIPTDSDGYPLIPDDPGYIEAVYWYIRVKLLYPEWVSGRITDRVYYHAEHKWNFYCKQAYANVIMPNADQLESIKNKWLELVPELTDHSTFFSTSGQEQKIYNDTFYRNRVNILTVGY